MSQESRKGYLKRVFRQAKTDSDFLSVKKAIGSIGFGVLRSLFHRDATTVRDFLVGIVLPALAAYAVLCAGELAWNIVRAPFTLDRQRANELNSRDHEIAKLNKQLALFFSITECLCVCRSVPENHQPHCLVGHFGLK